MRGGSGAVWLILAGCAGISVGEAPAQCREGPIKADDRSVDWVLDSAQVSTDLVPILGDHPGLVLAIMDFDSVGGLDSVRVVGSDLSETVAAEVEKVLRAEVRDQSMMGAAYFELRTREAMSLRSIHRPPACPPQLLNAIALARLMADEAQARGVLGPVQVLVEAVVDRDGRVVEVRLVESSGIVPADRAALQVARRGRYRPATLAGIPVQVPVLFPIDFTPRRE